MHPPPREGGGRPRASYDVAAPATMVVMPRRFCDQQASLDSVQMGRSLPYEMVSIRSADTPWPVKNSFTALARRAPNARLYSRVPRSSALPSMRTRTRGYLISQAAWRCSSDLSLSSTRYLLSAKWTVSPTLTRKSCSLPGRIELVTGGGGVTGAVWTGGGGVVTTSCLCVQAARPVSP